MIRLMIVEDSATVREMLTYSLASEGDIEIVAIARDGKEAVEMAAVTKPNIILMDTNMPYLNGYEASARIMEENPTPILLMTATWDVSEVEKMVKSMNIGVLGIYEKPYGPGHPKYKELYEKIVSNIRVMSDVKVVRRWNHNSNNHTKDIMPMQKIAHSRERSFVLIGSSTGGPPVLHTILKALGADYPLPILVAQHMSSEFIESFIVWLNEECALSVKKAVDGETISGGFVYIAPANYHLTLQNHTIKLIEADKNDLYVPSVSKLFYSVSDRNADEAVAILLSGMGNDGAQAITKLRECGAVTAAQNKATSVIFGMANEAVKKGGIEFLLSPEGIAELLLGMQVKQLEKRQ